jgi:hypothetical protein
MSDLLIANIHAHRQFRREVGGETSSHGPTVRSSDLLTNGTGGAEVTPGEFAQTPGMKRPADG